MHDSWFSLLPFHERVEAFARQHFGWPFNEQGQAWFFHGPAGVQHVYAALFVLYLIAMIAVITDTSIRAAGKNLLPAERLTVVTFVELVVGTAYRMMSDIMGAKAARHFLPLIGTCAFFILLSNLVGLVPGFLPATDNFNTTIVLGLVIFVVTHIYGLKENGWLHIKHFFGPIWWLAPLMVVIELISHIARPLSLAIRLMANMMADHMVLTIFCGLLPAVLFWVPIPLPMYLLGTLVAVVQTLVFCLLSTVYIAMAIEHAEAH
jgi:F-type H+-transporting ATPase subunit a